MFPGALRNLAEAGLRVSAAAQPTLPCGQSRRATSPTLRTRTRAITVPALAVAATSPGYAAGYTYSTPNAVDSPPAQAASCAATTAATSKA